jgi:acyl transferase domain-containing protein
MKPVSSAYADLLASIQVKRPNIPFYSSVTGAKVDSDTLDAAYWVSNLLSPVLFYPAVSRLLSDFPDAVLLEIGPHSALAGPLQQTMKATNSAKAEYVSTLVKDQDASSAMLTSMGNLFQRGVHVRFERVVTKGNVLTDSPRYAWNRQGPYWTESRLSQGWRQREFPKHDILGARVVEASEYDPTWRCLLRLDAVPWIRDHDISHDAVFPGAGYVAMAGEAIRQLTGEVDFTVREVTISNALVLLEGVTTEIITHIKPLRLTTTLDSTWYDFDIASYNSSTGRWIKHAVGQARGGCSYETSPPKIAPQKRVVGSPKWYSVMKRFGLNYGPRFQGMREITAGVSKQQAVAYIDNITEDSESFYTMHPCTIDFAFQLFSVAAFKGLSRLFTQLSVPTYIGELYIRPTSTEIFINVPGKRVAQASESRTPPTLRTSPISIHNASTQRYSNTIK